eukprot:gb/GEZN01010579.1/.p1 GENE.gb/GEZN01010579.1/~~gb/GEZN01010579.1/.p1  ORF type:complete len:368 (+),score=80.98 gb/GEZN01010579.1/:124-1104(+)
MFPIPSLWGLRLSSSFGFRPRSSSLAFFSSSSQLIRFFSSSSQIIRSDSETVAILRSPRFATDLILVGTNHISQKSAEEVRDTIRLWKPDAVMIELCQDRFNKMMKEAGKGQEQWMKGMEALLPPHLLAKVAPFAGQGKGGSEHWVRTMLNRFYDIFRGMGFLVGEEFKTAVMEAEQLKCRLVLGDQPQQITMQAIVKGGQKDFMAYMSGSRVFPYGDPRMTRLDRVLNPTGKPVGFDSLFRKEEVTRFIEHFKSRSQVSEMTSLVNDVAPNLSQGLLHERDAYMVAQLEKMAKQGHKTIVAVVGMAHMDGIEKGWMEQPKPQKIS